MKKTILLPIAILMAIGLTSCQNESRNSRDKAATSVTDTTMDTTQRAQMYTSDVDLQGNEKIFILRAINDAMLNVETATIVERTTKDRLLKSFAKKMIATGTKMNQDLAAIAKGKGINPPEAHSEENMKQITALNAVSGKLLDKTYIKITMKSLAESDVLFGKAATFNNKDLKTFAMNALPEIQLNQKEAVAIGKKLNVSNQNNGDDLQ